MLAKSEMLAEADKIKEADVLMASVKTNNYPVILEYFVQAREIKPGITTMIGGSHATAMPEQCLENDLIDFVVIGEGEITLAEWLDVYQSTGDDYSQILGLGYKQGKEVKVNSLRPLIEALDALPMPAYHLLPGGLKEYHPYIDTSRGCMYQCGFCSGPNFWRRKMRTRSFANFYKELELIKSLMGDYNFIHISDPMLGVTPQQLEILNQLKEKEIDLYFSCDVKANYIRPDLIQLMKDSGIIIFSIGIETLNDKALTLLKKNCTAELEIEACRAIKKFDGIYVKSYWIVGLPGEDKESLQYNNEQIYNLLKTEAVDQVCNHILVPYPGTEFFHDPKQFGINIMHDDWIHYEGRSYPLIYKLDNLSGDEIYKYFLEAHEYELKYYKEAYPSIAFTDEPGKQDQDNMSFGKYKGRLL